MKRRIQVLSALLTLMFATAASGQGTFQNLDFESVNILPADQRGFFPFSNLFPGWTGYLGTNQTSEAFYNGISAGAALSSVLWRHTAYSNIVISGNYTAVLVAGEDRIINPQSTELVSAAIAQSSLVPASSMSLRFRLGEFGLTHSYVDGLLVTFNGQNIPFYPLATGANFVLYGGDISMFAGVTGELRFTERYNAELFPAVYLDAIEFSPVPIPEPGIFGMLGLGALFLGGRWFKSHR